jgi:two-component system, chemotaxis family, protein-glutamate methylesterase/glutaminase
MPNEVERSDEIIRQDQLEQEHGERHGEPTFYSCPECGGVIWQFDINDEPYFICHTGHKFSSESMMVQMSENLEETLWISVRLLKERATLAHQVAAQAGKEGFSEMVERFEQRARRDERRLELILHQLLEVDHIDPEGDG